MYICNYTGVYVYVNVCMISRFIRSFFFFAIFIQRSKLDQVIKFATCYTQHRYRVAVLYFVFIWCSQFLCICRVSVNPQILIHCSIRNHVPYSYSYLLFTYKDFNPHRNSGLNQRTITSKSSFVQYVLTYEVIKLQLMNDPFDPICKMMVLHKQR